MSALLERADQAISATALVRTFGTKLKEVSSRTSERLVVVKDNQPVAVLINVDAYQEMLDELADLRIEATARERVLGFDETSSISHEEMASRYQPKHPE